MRQNRLMRTFRQAGVASESASKRLDEIPCRYSWVFRRMAARGVFVDVGDERYYMDEQAADEFVRRRRRRVLALTGIGLLLFVLCMLITSRW